jgi:carbon starvation protein
MKKLAAHILWFLIALAGAWAYAKIAFDHGQHLNSAFILIAALCSYAIGYRFYSKWVAARVLMLNDRRATPCQVHDDGKDFVKTNKWIVFGHHFAAISGPGPLVGPVLAAQFGYLPGTLWILIGVVLGGAVQDFVVLFSSLRRDGKSLAQMVKEELNTVAGAIASAAILAIMIILLAVLALVVVRALAKTEAGGGVEAGSPWGVFTVGATIPIAILMGLYLRFIRIGKVMEASVFGIVFLLLAVYGGKLVYQSSTLSKVFTIGGIPMAWGIIIYGFAASVLPVWLLLAPRDYLSTFMKLGTIFTLAIGIFCVLPDLQMHRISRFIDGSGPVVPGKVFPFCFITIACGAISGFHTLISSGTTPKLITRESYARPVGYGAMCLESLVAIMALIAACTLEPGVYLSMNMKGDPATTAQTISNLGFPVTVQHMNELAVQIGEPTLFGRTGGAATLAVGMAQIFSKLVSGRWLDLWYHFAVMFEALFILTTLDAGTRVGRYLLQDVLGHFWKPLGETKSFGANALASVLVVLAWGYFLIQGVRDPLGGINSLWPLFGIANQMLAAIALCLATTILLKMQLSRVDSKVQNPTSFGKSTSEVAKSKIPRPAFMLVTLIPLAWLLTVTMTAGVQKIFDPNPRIGFLADARKRSDQQPALDRAVQVARATGEPIAIRDAEKKAHDNQVGRLNDKIDLVVAGTFLLLVAAVALLSIREWLLLLAHRKLPALKEAEPVWLPDYAVAESNPVNAAALLALGLGLLKEFSGEAHLQRAREAQACSHQHTHSPDGKLDPQTYVQATESRFSGIRRCC